MNTLKTFQDTKECNAGQTDGILGKGLLLCSIRILTQDHLKCASKMRQSPVVNHCKIS